MRLLAHIILLGLGFYYLLEAVSIIAGLALFSLFLMWMGAKDVWKKLSETPRQKRERERLAAWNKQLEDRLTQIKERYPERDDYDSNGIPYGP